MPSTIPYDPSFKLAGIVAEEALAIIKKISVAQAVPAAAQKEIDALLKSRRDLEVTRAELQNLGIRTPDIDNAINGMKESISTAATAYATAKIKAEEITQSLKAQLQSVRFQGESPVNHVKTEVKTLQIVTPSMNMDVQYFSVASDDQLGKIHESKIADFIARSNSLLGEHAQQRMSQTVQRQIASEFQGGKKITGTVVISISCTHKNAVMLTPLILDFEKGVTIWNHFFGNTDKIDTTNAKEMLEIAQEGGIDKGNKLHILSGMSFGSSLIGMVHLHGVINKSAERYLERTIAKIQQIMEPEMSSPGCMDAIDAVAKFGSWMKSWLKDENLNAPVTLMTMGVKVPSEVDLTSIIGTVNSLSALETMSPETSEVSDVNSLTTAAQDYLRRVGDLILGALTQYYIKDITKSMLAQMWMAKYYRG